MFDMGYFPPCSPPTLMCFIADGIFKRRKRVRETMKALEGKVFRPGSEVSLAHANPCITMLIMNIQ